MTRWPLGFAGLVLLALSLPATARLGAAQQDIPPPNVVAPDNSRGARAEGQIITIYDPQTGKELVRIQGHTDKVTSLAFTVDAKRLASGSLDRKVNMWDVPTGKLLFTAQFSDGVLSIRWSGDGRNMVVRLASGSSVTLDALTGQKVKE
jgi:WD40 repeat protein